MKRLLISALFCTSTLASIETQLIQASEVVFKELGISQSIKGDIVISKK
jgi:hypothetical protein